MAFAARADPFSATYRVYDCQLQQSTSQLTLATVAYPVYTSHVRHDYHGRRCFEDAA